MLGALLALTLAVSDAGVADVNVRRLVNDLVRLQTGPQPASLQAEVSELRKLAQAAGPTERQLIERVVTVLLGALAEPPSADRLLSETATFLRDVARLVRGRFEEERAIGEAWLSVTLTARRARLAPEAYRREGMAFIRDLVARYPTQGAVHGQLASALTESNADDKLVLASLKRCAELDPRGSCPSRHAQLLADMERPRCSGRALLKPLTVTGARAVTDRPPGAIVTSSGAAFVPEAKPILTSVDFSAVVLDGDGALWLECTPAGAARLARESTRLQAATGGLVIKLGDEVLMTARVESAITGGRIRATRGAGALSFGIETLCRSLERPVVPAELRLAQ